MLDSVSKLFPHSYFIHFVHAGNEAALLMRLHLLQAIVAFHLHKIKLAQELLMKAEYELQALKVNTDDIATLVGLGKFYN